MTELNFKRILSLAILVTGLVVMNGTELHAQSKKTNNAQKDRVTKESGMEMLEINPDKLPEEVKQDIIENFHNAEIVKAYKVWHPGAKRHEFWVDVKQGPKKWSLQFDADGNAINKINPGD
jgi:hypothetical protein